MARGSSLYRSVVKVLEFVPTFHKLSERAMRIELREDQDIAMFFLSVQSFSPQCNLSKTE